MAIIAGLCGQLELGLELNAVAFRAMEEAHAKLEQALVQQDKESVRRDKAREQAVVHNGLDIGLDRDCRGV